MVISSWFRGLHWYHKTWLERNTDPAKSSADKREARQGFLTHSETLSSAPCNPFIASTPSSLFWRSEITEFKNSVWKATGNKANQHPVGTGTHLLLVVFYFLPQVSLHCLCLQQLYLGFLQSVRCILIWKGVGKGTHQANYTVSWKLPPPPFPPPP